MAHYFNGKVYVCVDDFKKSIQQILAKNALDYYEAGSDDQITRDENVKAYQKYIIIPRLLINIKNLDTSSFLLGYKVSMPISIAPTALQKMAHPDGEKATARAAMKAGVCMCLSSLASTSMEDVAKSCDFEGIRFYQLYYNSDKNITTNLLKRAKENGYKAIALTVDAQVSGFRRVDHYNKFKIPEGVTFANYENTSSFKEKSTESQIHNMLSSADPTMSWDDLAWIKKTSQLPLVLKGILSAKDAEIARNYDVDAIWISNHGGRQIDGCPTSIDVLPSIAKALKGSGIEIFADGGIRKGSDVFKALALGANHVFVGRPALYGLSVGGEAGVSAVLNILHTELKRNMQLSGATTIPKITSEFISMKSKF